MDKQIIYSQVENLIKNIESGLSEYDNLEARDKELKNGEYIS